MNDSNIETNNEQWEQLAFVLEDRDKPTLIVIGFDTYATREIIYKQIIFIEKFSNYKFYDLDISTLPVVSLHQLFLENLPKRILNSKPAEVIVNVFGVENSLFTIHDKEIIESPFIRQLNFEREIFFREFPFITIIWTDSYTVNTLKKKAKDLWDWISYQFEFKTESEERQNIYLPSRGIQIFISYPKEDIEIAEKLYNDLKQNGFIPWMNSKDIIPRQNLELAIRDAIKKSSFFLALQSSNLLTKKNYIQERELEMALRKQRLIEDYEIFIVPVRIDNCMIQEEIKGIQKVDLFPSYDEGFKRILISLNHYSSSKQSEKINNINGDIDIISGYGNLMQLQERYDTLKLDDDSRERVIKEKLNIQKLIGKEYMKREDYYEAEQSFRLALSLAQQIKDFEYEKEEISFLLNQVYYQP